MIAFNYILGVFPIQSKIDRLQGANVEVLESKIQQHIGSSDEEGEDFGQGLVNNETIAAMNIVYKEN